MLRGTVMRGTFLVSGVAAFFVFGACGGSAVTSGDGDETGGGVSQAGGGGPGGGGGIGGKGGPGGAGGITPHTDGGAGGTGGSVTGGWPSCFAVGTTIATPRGDVPIERLRVGDVVLGYDEATHRVVESPVTETFVFPDRHPGTLTTSDGRTLRVTGEHPIYVPDANRYVEAKDLAGDERLLALGARGAVRSSIGSALEPSTTTETVYNITVAGVHNYFAEGVLVHNKTGGSRNNCLPYQAGADVNGCAVGGCIHPRSPTAEFITTNQRVPGFAADAGAALPDAGSDEDAGPPGMPIPPATTKVSAEFCALPSAPYPTTSFLAFDTIAPPGTPVFQVYSGYDTCSGTSVGEVWLWDFEPPLPYTWTTQCVELGAADLRDSVFVRTTSPGTRVSNLRFVSGCDCPRVLKRRTTCAVTDPTGKGGGSACY